MSFFNGKKNSFPKLEVGKMYVVKAYLPMYESQEFCRSTGTLIEGKTFQIIEIVHNPYGPDGTSRGIQLHFRVFTGHATGWVMFSQTENVGFFFKELNKPEDCDDLD